MSRNSWRKKAPDGVSETATKVKHTNKRATNPEPERVAEGPDIAAIPKVGTLRQWDKDMKTEARIRRRPNGVAVRTNPDPPPQEAKKPDQGYQKPPSKKRRRA